MPPQRSFGLKIPNPEMTFLDIWTVEAFERLG